MIQENLALLEEILTQLTVEHLSLKPKIVYNID